MKIIYTAQFVQDPEELLKTFPPKHSKTFAHHITIAFRPKDLEGIQIGRKSTIKIIGRGFDEKGDALILEEGAVPVKNPHITLSCAEGVAPAYSKELIEKALENGNVEYFAIPQEVAVVEGYFDGTKDVISK